MRMVLIVSSIFLGLAGCSTLEMAGRAPSAQTELAAIVFMTDFGAVDDAVAICKGAMLGVEPRSRIVDVTHQIKPYAIQDAARYLGNLTTYYPAGTVFITVVDPGVGSERKAIVAKTKRGQYFVGPDNGLITFISDRDGIEAVREITNVSWQLTNNISSTFHGRDIFSPVAARLARGDDWTQVGPVLINTVRLDVRKSAVSADGVSGEVVGLDGQYGNLITNIPFSEVAKLGYEFGTPLKVSIGKKNVSLHVVKWFSYVPVNKPLLYPDSNNLVAFAVNQGNFARAYSLSTGARVFIPAKGK